MDDRPDSLLMRFPLAQRRPVFRMAIAVAITLAAYLARQALDGWLPPGLPYVTFFPAVVVSAFLLGVRPGIVSGVLGFVLSWYFFIPPVGFGVTFATVLALALYVFVVVVDLALIHWMQRAQARVVDQRQISRDLAHTREMLFQELQHRVGNNLQMVGSMLALQKRGLEGEAAVAIGDAARRIALIGKMQRDLYSAHGTQSPLLDLVGKVCRDTLAAHGRSDVALVVDGDSGVSLAPDRAIPASVIVAESVANAIEHGMAARGGTITAQVTASSDAVQIAVRDDGAGLPEGFTASGATSLGLRLATALARQIDGTFDLRRDGTQTLALLRIPV